MVLRLHALLQLVAQVTASTTFFIVPVSAKMHLLQLAAIRQSYCICTPSTYAVVCTQELGSPRTWGCTGSGFVRIANIQYSSHAIA